MIPRTVLYPALCAGIILLIGCGRHTTAAITLTGQIITLSDTLSSTDAADTVHFGRMRSGETVVKQLRLYNAGNTPKLITSYTRTCGCSTLEFDSQPIIPGHEIPASLSFDSRGLYGWQFKSIELQLSGDTSPRRIYIEAEVE